MKLLVTLLLFMTTITFESKEKEGKFKIYCFDRTSFEYNLSTYEYDSTWVNFMKSANLKKASLIISDEEIEYYDWKKQEIKLTNSGLEKLKEFTVRNNYLDHLNFIVTLDDKRIYAGEFLTFMSQIAIRHPVIHYDIEKSSWSANSLRIYPVHTVWDLPELPSEILNRTATNEVMSYFKSINKLH